MNCKVLLNRLSIIIATTSALTISGCHSVDDERIPYAPVHLSFATIADWNQWVVKQQDAANSARFIYVPSIGNIMPAGYPYKAADATGYGGLLLVTDALGNEVAYDLACPVEARPEVRLYVPEGEFYAQCPKCGSTFDLITNHGNPRSGPAADKGYGLQRYSIVSGGALEYRVVTR